MAHGNPYWYLPFVKVSKNPTAPNIKTNATLSMPEGARFQIDLATKTIVNIVIIDPSIKSAVFDRVENEEPTKDKK
jgi:hypothetical protein